jgi:hypothetical protein
MRGIRGADQPASAALYEGALAGLSSAARIEPRLYCANRGSRAAANQFHPPATSA